MIDPVIEFRGTDLNKSFNSERVDLAMSLEVAEHLHNWAAEEFIGSLVQASDVVLFGAACKGQGGLITLMNNPIILVRTF